MFKPKRLLFSLSFFLLSFHPFVFAQQESVTITTYYPSPYGSYREMRAQRMAIGDDYIKGDQYCWWPDSCITTIDANADLVVQGNVGIGTTSPAAKLHVQDYNNPGQPPVVLDRNYDGSRIQLKYGGYNTSSELGMTYYQSGKVDLWIGSNLNSTGAGHTGIQQANTGGPSWYERFGSIGDAYNLGHIPAGGAASTFVTINGSGNVGIGTTGPGYKLDVNGDVNFAAGNSLYIGANANRYITYRVANNDIIYSMDSGDFYYQDIANSAHAWYTGNSERMRITSTGNVGIGTTNPGRKLHVGSGATNAISTPTQILVSDASSAAHVSYTGGAENVLGTQTGEPKGFIGMFSNDNLGIMTNNAVRIFIATGGNVGIGTTSPGSYTLNVAGTINTSGGCTGCSDARWKTNIAPISAPLDKIMVLTGVQFNWKTKEYPSMFFQEGLDYGLVAQDVEKALPEIVYENNGYKYIRYDRLSAILIEAAKEQQKEIKEQRKEINDLKEELAQQKAEIASLKGKL